MISIKTNKHSFISAAQRALSVFTMLAILLHLAPKNSLAAQMPRYIGSEKKIRSYIYNPNNVYHYLGHYIYQGFIEFDGDETIDTISMGDQSLWLFQHVKNRLFLKPIGKDNSDTNMTVITNKRVYQFELTAKTARGITDPNLVFVTKFLYPDDKKDPNIKQFARSSFYTDEPDLRDLTKFNFDYQYTGEKSIAPIKVFDNSEFTYFEFPKKNAEIPAMFSVDPEGFESLVNFRSSGNYIIVEKVTPQFTLRSGNQIVCVYNMKMYVDGKYRANAEKNKNKNKNKEFLAFEPVSKPKTQSMQPQQISSPEQTMSVSPAVTKLPVIAPNQPYDVDGSSVSPEAQMYQSEQYQVPQPQRR